MAHMKPLPTDTTPELQGEFPNKKTAVRQERQA